MPAGGAHSPAGFVMRRKDPLMTPTFATQIGACIYRSIITAFLILSVLTANTCLAQRLNSNQPIGEEGLKAFEEVTEEKRGTNLRIFTSQDSGMEFKLSVGEAFQVHLPENPTTGYLWTILESSSPNIELERKEFLPAEAPGIVGAGGMRIFVFNTTKRGQAVLHLGLKRSWEKEGKCAETYSLKLVVE
jgi:inhibitor of cysteine peptidase